MVKEDNGLIIITEMLIKPDLMMQINWLMILIVHKILLRKVKLRLQVQYSLTQKKLS